MTITPGEITLELLFENPVYYLAFIYVGSVILSAVAAWWSDRQADNSLKNTAKSEHPELTKQQLDDVYEFENVRDPIIAGILACVAVVFPMIGTLDAVGDFSLVFASAVLTGITSRIILMKLAKQFISKVGKQT